MNKVDVSKQISYWLRHDPEDLEMDEKGYVEMSELLEKLKDRFPDIDREFIEKVNSEGKRRYEIKEDKIRALYGHSLGVDLDLPEDEEVKELFHGTTEWGTKEIMENGLKSKDRNKVHLSATKEIAREIGRRRTENPVILVIDVEKARKDGLKFYRATDQVYLCDGVPPQYIKKI